MRGSPKSDVIPKGLLWAGRLSLPPIGSADEIFVAGPPSTIVALILPGPCPLVREDYHRASHCRT